MVLYFQTKKLYYCISTLNETKLRVHMLFSGNQKCSYLCRTLKQNNNRINNKIE